jgi:hypothetical protein
MLKMTNEHAEVNIASKYSIPDVILDIFLNGVGVFIEE